jgi:reactive intermediate/imine deaminase
MNKNIINTDQAPAAIGPYSQALEINGMIYISGQIPLDPDSMAIVSDDFEVQANQVFQNLAAIALAANSSLANAVKLTIYVTDLANFTIVNEVMEEFIPAPFPARAAVQVSALPKGALVEVDAILVVS